MEPDYRLGGCRVSLSSARKAISAIAGVSAFALFLTACGSSTPPAATSSSTATTTSGTTTSATTSASTSSSGTATSTSSSGTASPVADDDKDWCDKVKAKYGDLTGKSVSIFGSITSPESDLYNQAWKLFTDCTGAAVVYEGTKSFEADVKTRWSSGNPPDMALFPQPGLLQQTVQDSGLIQPLDDMATGNIDKYYGDAWKGYGTVNGVLYGAPNTANFKSLIWYSPKNFKTHGYTVPKTYDDLIALSDKIAATGSKPWCVGVSSGDATGWPLTDWLEDYVLRTAGPDVYDQWVSHDVKFSDPKIATALADVAKIVKNEKYVNGGVGDVKTIAGTTFQNAGLPILQDQCTFHRQANFYEANWPAGTKVGPDGDVDAFYFPGIDPQFGNPVLGGGEFFAAFADRPEIKAFQYFATTASYTNARAKLGGVLFANKAMDAANVPSPVLQTALKVLQDPKTVYRFDASDLMPGAVGSDAEFKQFTAWITGQDDATTLANIDAAWPTS